jgi:hypothetical protein
MAVLRSGPIPGYPRIVDLDTRLELADLDTFWLPPDARRVARRDVVYLACDRDQPHLNCGLAIRGRDEALPALLDEVLAAHAGVTSRWKLAAGSRGPAMEAGLTARAYAVAVEHRAYGIDPADYRRTVPDGIVAHEIRTMDDLVDATTATAAAFARRHPIDRGLLGIELRDCTRPGRRIVRFVARDRGTGQALGAAGLNVYPGLRLGFLWAGGVIPEARGRGVYTALVAARLAAAERLGLDVVGVYARVGSSAPILARQGFTAHGQMTYWERPAG